MGIEGGIGTVAVSKGPQRRDNRRRRPEEFGAGVLDPVLATVVKVGDDDFSLAKEVKKSGDEATYLKLLSKAEGIWQNDLHGEEGLTKQLGLNAEGVIGRGTTRYQDIGDEVSKEAKNDTQRRALARAWQGRFRFARSTLTRHELKQVEAAQTASRAGQIETERNKAILNAGDEDILNSSVGNISQIVGAEAKRLGLDEDAAASALRGELSPLYRGYIAELSETNPVRAREMLTSVKDGMNATDYEAVDQIVELDELNTKTLSEAVDIHRGTGTLDEKLQGVNDRDDLTTDEKEGINKRLRQMSNDQRTSISNERALRHEDLMDEATGIVDKLAPEGQVLDAGDMTMLQKLRDNLVRRAPDVHSRNEIDAVFDSRGLGQSVETDFGVYFELMNRTTLDSWSVVGEDGAPRKTTPKDYFSKLDNEAREELTRRYAKIVSNKGKVDWERTEALAYAGTYTADMDKDDAGRFTRMVENDLTAWVSITKRIPKTEEIKQVVEEANLKRIQEPWTISIPTGDTPGVDSSTVPENLTFDIPFTGGSKARYEMTPVEHLQTYDRRIRVIALEMAIRNTGSPNPSPNIVEGYASSVVRFNEQIQQYGGTRTKAQLAKEYNQWLDAKSQIAADKIPKTTAQTTLEMLGE